MRRFQECLDTDRVIARCARQLAVLSDVEGNVVQPSACIYTRDWPYMGKAFENVAEARSHNHFGATTDQRVVGS